MAAQARRRGIDGAAVSAAAGTHLVGMIRHRFRGRVVAGYRSIGTEMSPACVMHQCHAMGWVLCVPAVEEQDLVFGRWVPGMAMVHGQFGIEVPSRVDPVEPEVLIVPLLAYDRAGWRLGYGGGYYDRALARLRSIGSITAIGFAASAQQVEAVPHDGHDQRLDWVATETGVRACPRTL